MQRFLFRKVEVWLLLLALLLSIFAALVFAAAALDAERNKNRTGPISRAALRLAETPLTARDLVRGNDPRLGLRTRKLAGRVGWRLAAGLTGLPGEGYLLMSRYDGTRGGASVELIDLRDLSVRHRWLPDADALFAGITLTPDPTVAGKWNRYYFEAVHPWLRADGGLLVKDHFSPLFHIDRCGGLVAADESLIFHHSTEADADGNLWMPVHIRPRKPDYPPDFSEDGLAQFAPDGRLLQLLSLPDIYEANGLFAQIFGAGAYDDDPFHLNDIQPVLADSPHWRKGDLFLSLRHVSTVLLFRPSTGRILWLKQGPWLGQHDVDILDDHRIAVFDNRAYQRGRGPLVADASETVIYDFATGTITAPLRAAFRREQIETFSEGLQELTEAGNLIVEEENAGRLAILAPDGALLAEFVNRADNGKIYTMSWSRPIGRAQGDAVLAAIAAAPPCRAP
jgi:hypothetical protein